MTDIRVTPLEEGAFGVELAEGDTRTNHRVTVSSGFLDQLGLADADPAIVVEESFEFLLEREPATSILSSFSLEAITGFFPEYPSELPPRVAARAG